MTDEMAEDAQITFRVSTELRDRLEARADAEGIKLGELIRGLLADAVEASPGAAVITIEVPDGRFRVRSAGPNRYVIEAGDS